MEDQVEVTVQFMENGLDGAGWYAWETEYPEEGCFWVGDKHPTAEDLKAICEIYVEAN